MSETDTVNYGNLVKVAFHISGKQKNYSVEVDSWAAIWGKEINQSWIYGSQPELKLIRDFIKMWASDY